MLTASIVVHKTPPPQLQKAIQCLLRSDIERVYIIDNSPVDSLRRSLPEDHRLDYRHVENNGFGAGHNIAIREALKRPGEGYHLVMNADVCWEGDVLKPLVDYLHKNTDVGMVMPKVFYPDGALQYTCRMLPTPLDLFAKRFLPKSITQKRMERYLLAEHDHDKPLNCPYLLGSFLLFRNDALRACGIFDERYFMYPEDIDITRRIHIKWRTMYWPGVSIIHEHAAESRKSKKMLKIHISNMIKYFNKWGWLIDPTRRRLNRRLRKSISPLPVSKRPVARG
ncbi:MAG: glycosyltransferase [Bacteroides sp.]|nr:glycosyltransferase [Bacteroides sp.]